MKYLKIKHFVIMKQLLALLTVIYFSTFAPFQLQAQSVTAKENVAKNTASELASKIAQLPNPGGKKLQIVVMPIYNTSGTKDEQSDYLCRKIATELNKLLENKGNYHIYGYKDFTNSDLTQLDRYNNFQKSQITDY